jgi:hypothetical protein
VPIHADDGFRSRSHDHFGASLLGPVRQCRGHLTLLLYGDGDQQGKYRQAEQEQTHGGEVGGEIPHDLRMGR